MNIKERILRAASNEGIAVSRLEKLAGLSNGYFRSMKKSPGVDKLEAILKVLNRVNRDWILYGTGEMYSDKVSHGNSININGNSNSTISTGDIVQNTANFIRNTNEEEVEEQIPVIPMEMYAEPNLDVYEVVHSEEFPTRTSPVIKQFSSYDTYYIVYGDEMAPFFMPGDKVGIRPYNTGDERKLVSGRSYVINTKTNGMLLRMLYPVEGGFRGVAHNPRYADIFIESEDVIRVFYLSGLIRTFI